MILHAQGMVVTAWLRVTPYIVSIFILVAPFYAEALPKA